MGIVARARGGDIGAQSQLVRAYQRRVTGHVRSIIRHVEDAEDITQIVMAKMIARIARLRDATVFEAWLFTLSRNSTVDYIRRRRCQPQCIGDEAFSRIPATNDPVRLNELRQEVDLALGQLPTIDRTVVALFVEGHSYEVIAAKIGVSPKSIKRRLHRVRPILRDRLRSQ